jgi:hypothetical protein
MLIWVCLSKNEEKTFTNLVWRRCACTHIELCLILLPSKAGIMVKVFSYNLHNASEFKIAYQLLLPSLIFCHEIDYIGERKRFFNLSKKALSVFFLPLLHSRLPYSWTVFTLFIFVQFKLFNFQHLPSARPTNTLMNAATRYGPRYNQFRGLFCDFLERKYLEENSCKLPSMSTSSHLALS